MVRAFNPELDRGSGRPRRPGTRRRAGSGVRIEANAAPRPGAGRVDLGGAQVLTLTPVRGRSDAAELHVELVADRRARRLERRLAHPDAIAAARDQHRRAAERRPVQRPGDLPLTPPPKPLDQISRDVDDGESRPAGPPSSGGPGRGTGSMSSMTTPPRRIMRHTIRRGEAPGARPRSAWRGIARSSAQRKQRCRSPFRTVLGARAVPYPAPTRPVRVHDREAQVKAFGCLEGRVDVDRSAAHPARTWG